MLRRLSIFGNDSLPPPLHSAAEAILTAHSEKHINQQIGFRLRRTRTKRGLTQQKLGHQLGVSFQQIQKYEKGIDGLSAAKLMRLARILRVNINYFYEPPPSEETAG